MTDEYSCYQKVNGWMYGPSGEVISHGMYAYMLVALSHSSDDMSDVVAGTCYAGLWYQQNSDYPSVVGGVGLDPSIAEVPAAALPSPYGLAAPQVCASVYGASAWVLYSQFDMVICSDSDVNAAHATYTPWCSDLGVDDPDSLTTATQSQVLAFPRSAFTVCKEQSFDDPTVPIGRPSGLFGERPGNLPYASCADYAASAPDGDDWVSLNRRTACRAGWIRYWGLAWIAGGVFLKVGSAHFDTVESVTIDQAYGFTATLQITTVADDMPLTNPQIAFVGCDTCSNITSTSSTSGTDMSASATFTAAAANAASTYTVEDWATSKFAYSYEWNPFGLFRVRAGLANHQPSWRCTRNGYINQTPFEGRMYTGPSGCVFPWAAGLVTFPQVATNGVNMAAINNHMIQAQQSGLPGAVGSGTYLHYLGDKTMQNANRATACPGDLPRPIDYSCDEYPFRSTYEGAAQPPYGGPRSFPGCQMSDPSGTGPVGYSRCFVPGPQNSAQGALLLEMIRNDQLLNGDPYQVRIMTQ